MLTHPVAGREGAKVTDNIKAYVNAFFLPAPDTLKVRKREQPHTMRLESLEAACKDPPKCELLGDTLYARSTE